MKILKNNKNSRILRMKLQNKYKTINKTMIKLTKYKNKIINKKIVIVLQVFKLKIYKSKKMK